MVQVAETAAGCSEGGWRVIVTDDGDDGWWVVVAAAAAAAAAVVVAVVALVAVACVWRKGAAGKDRMGKARVHEYVSVCKPVCTW